MRNRSKIRLMSVVATCVSLWLLGTTPVVLAAVGFQSLGMSTNAVDVWFLTCTNSGTTARASVTDNGGVDGTHIYIQLANTGLSSASHRTVKTTAPDGGASSTVNVAIVETGGSRPAYISVGRHIGSPTSEPYKLNARCTNSSGETAPHTLILIQ